MFLEFIVIIFPLLSLKTRVYNFTKAVIWIRFKETTSMDGPFESLGGRLRLGLGLKNGVKITNVPSMRLCCL
jgi:hypothetical protein